MSHVGIALYNPKYAHNVGAVLRAASCWGAHSVTFNGQRIIKEILDKGRIPREERLRGYKHVGLYHQPDPIEFLCEQHKDVIPIGVEFRENTECLFDFEHPENALYVFGPEDGSLDRQQLTRCHRFVTIPTLHCTNLSAAVYTLLYDRCLKAYWNSGVRPRDLEVADVAEENNVALFVKSMEKMLAAAG